MRGKRELDETDIRIVQLLAENGRRAFSEIADHVGLSPPAVSERVDRLREQGVIRGFTIAVDRQQLNARTPVLVEFQVTPPHAGSVYEQLSHTDGIEHVFQTHDSRVVAQGHAPTSDLSDWLAANVEMANISQFDISLLDKQTWSMTLDDSEFTVSCVVCENTVDSDGVRTEFDGETKAFCCSSCLAAYESEYDARQSNVE